MKKFFLDFIKYFSNVYYYRSRSRYIRNNLDLEVIYLDNYDLGNWGELKYKYNNDSGFDLRASLVTNSIKLYNDNPTKISAGVKFKIPKGYEIVIRPRSGLASKGVICSFGTIDQDYRGEIIICLYNHNKNSDYIIHKGDRIAQAVLQKKYKCNIVTVKKFSDETDRNEKGWGSSGIK